MGEGYSLRAKQGLCAHPLSFPAEHQSQAVTQLFLGQTGGLQVSHSVHIRKGPDPSLADFK